MCRLGSKVEYGCLDVSAEGYYYYQRILPVINEASDANHPLLTDTRVIGEYSPVIGKLLLIS